MARQTNMMGKVSDKLDSQGKPWGTQGAQDLVEGNGEKEGWGIWHLKKCVGSPRPEVGAFEALECPGRPRRKLALRISGSGHHQGRAFREGVCVSGGAWWSSSLVV